MASLVLGAAGAVVGSFFGMPEIGWAVGSALGSALFPGEGAKGPRLTDLKLQTSQYGQMIPLLYGVTRVAGDVIWQTDLQEHEHKSGGKGGGKSTTTYTYSASFAVMLCEGPIQDVTRIWADGRLIFDKTVGSALSNAFPFTALYLGTTTQGVDPTIEAVKGVGNVPAYRGRAYAVADTMYLTDFGNRIPSFEFEVTTQGLGDAPIRLIDANNAIGFFWGGTNFGHTSFPVPCLTQVPAVGSTAAQVFVFNVGVVPNTQNDFDYPSLVFTGNDTTDIAKAIPDMITLTFHYPPPTNWKDWVFWGVGMFNGQPVYYQENANAFPTGGDGSHSPALPSGLLSIDGGGIVLCAFDYGSLLPAGQFVRAVCFTPDQSTMFVFTAPDLFNTIDHWYKIIGTSIVALGSVVPNLGTPALAFGNSCENMRNGNWYSMCAEQNGKYFWVGDGVGAGSFAENVTVYKIDDGGNFAYDSVANAGQQYIGQTETFSGSTVMSPQEGYCFYAAASSIGLFCRLPIDAQQYPTLASVVSDLSVRAGLTTGDIDVSQLTDLVYGYRIANQLDCRTAIEPLQTAYFFDAVESDTVVKFVKRGATPVATIPQDDLAAQEGVGGAAPAIVTVQRAQEVDLPAVFSIGYMDKAAAYQPGTQLAQREVTQSQLITSVQLALVFTSDKAAQIAQVNLFMAWLERESFTVFAPRKYAHLEPCDVIDVPGYTLRITEKDEANTTTIKFTGVRAKAIVLVSSPVSSAPGGYTPGPTQSPQATTLLLLDIPLVADTDAPNGYYAAMNGATTARWAGATLYKSLDGGVNFDVVTTDITPDIFGAASTILGTFGGGNVFDEINHVTVVLNAGSGDLAGASEIQVLNGANEALIGNEFVQFKNAVLTAAKTYDLSGLLRGRRGTEWAMAQHGASDAFVLLPTSLNVAGPFPEIGAQRDFKAVTSGQTLGSATDVPFTNNGVALRCYSPVQIGGGLNGSGDLAITWLRRTRIGGTWVNFTDVPLSEASELYVVQIWDSTYTVCARVITGITSPQVTYTSAQQVTDFGAQQQVIYVTVGQIGTLGLGIQAGAALPGAGSTIDAPLNPVTPYNNPPPLPPPSGSCPGTVYTTSLTWAVGDSGIIQNPAGFDNNSTWLIDLTTPSSGAFKVRVWAFEYGSAPGTRGMKLTDVPCGNPLIPFVDQHSFYPQIYAVVGAPNPFPTQYATLQHSTTYYFVVTVPSVSRVPMAIEMDIEPA